MNKKALSLLRTYVAPGWASKLKCTPKQYVELAVKPTPIQRWYIPEVPDGFELSIKRDDLTGSILGGNKIRKLEFILGDAIEKKPTTLITCGSLQSNHCRITAAAAKHLGLNCHLLLRSVDQERDSRLFKGNLLLNRLYGAECYIVPNESLKGGLNARLEKLSQELKKKGEVPYTITLGGSNILGTFGIINSFQELIEQGIFSDFDDIVVATGSGGTLAGLAIANYLTGQKVRVHGVCVSDDANYFYQHIEETLKMYGIRTTVTRQICDIVEGFKGIGYAKTTPEDLDAIVDICRDTGILLDYCYTYKAVKGMLNEMKENPQRFKGNRVLYIYTGGIFSIFDETIMQSNKLQNGNVHVWRDFDDMPL